MPFRENNLDLEKKENIGVGIDVTQRCQCRCPTCFYEERDAENDINHELFRTIIDEAKENGFRELYFLGGEPTLHREIFDLIDYGSTGNFDPLILVTNGLRLSDEEFCRSIAERDVMVAVQRHVIGNDIKAERIQNVLMGVEGTLPIVNNAFQNVEEYFRPERVAVQCCITKPVVESGQIFEVFRYARDHGYEQVMECTKAGPAFRRGGRMDVSPEELFKVYRRFQVIDHEFFPKLIAKKLTPQAYGKVCHMPETGVHVLINGDVVPCVGQPYVLGNLKNEKLAGILKSKKRKFFQYPEERIEGHCKTCDYLTDCTGGCRGDAYYNTGCFNSSVLQCPEIAKKTDLSEEDFIPGSCSSCDMEYDETCNKKDIKKTLERYLGDRYES
ncbi:MAG: radical SAM protein [Candidatus Aenigmarchaeota archaeon]|nr:radical SAM protein [Candidatus Aenigmarchaeota archaeon]